MKLISELPYVMYRDPPLFLIGLPLSEVESAKLSKTVRGGTLEDSLLQCRRDGLTGRCWTGWGTWMEFPFHRNTSTGTAQYCVPTQARGKHTCSIVLIREKKQHHV